MSKYVSFDNLSRYDGKIKEYIEAELPKMSDVFLIANKEYSMGNFLITCTDINGIYWSFSSYSYSLADIPIHISSGSYSDKLEDVGIIVYAGAYSGVKKVYEGSLGDIEAETPYAGDITIAEAAIDYNLCFVLYTKKSSSDKVLASTSDIAYAISNKQDKLVSGTNIKTINSLSLLGNGNIDVTNIEQLKATDYNGSSNALVLENLKPGIYYLWNNSVPTIDFKGLRSSSRTSVLSVGSSNMQLVLILTQTPKSSMSDDTVLGIILTNKLEFSSAKVYGQNYILKYRTSNNSASNLTIETIKYETSSNIMSLNTTQTLSGKKIFGTLPESSEVPTTDDQLTNKKYVDDTVSNIGDVNQYFITGNSSSNPFIFKGKKKGVYHFIDKKPRDSIYYKFDTSNSVTSDPLVPLEINILKDIDGTETNNTLLGYATKAGTSILPFSSVYCMEIKRGTSSSTGLSTGIPANGSIQYVTVENSQTITSEKTFSTLPKSTVVPTNDAHLVNKKYVDDNSVKLITTNTNIWELAHGVYKVEAGVQLNYKTTSSGYITVGNYGTLLFVSKASNGSVPFYLLGRSVTNNTSNEMYIGVAQNNKYGICDVYNLSNIELAVTTADNQTIYGKKNFYVLPESSVVPTTDNQLVNKSYVDNTIIQKSTMPTASSSNEGIIVQFTGTTDSTYTNGYFYKCVSDGEETPTYSWQNISVQSGSGGGQSSITQDTYIKDLSPGVYLCTKSYKLYLGSNTTYYIRGYGLLEVSAGSNNTINFTFTTNDGQYYYVNADSELNSGNITTGTIITGVVQSNGNYTVYSRTALGTLIDRSENTSSNLCRVYVGHKSPTVSSSEVVTTTIKNYTITTTYVEPNTYSLSIASSRVAEDVAMAIGHGIGLIRVGNLVANTPKTYTINVSDDDDIDIWVYEHFGDFRPEVSLTGNYDDLINKPVTYLGKTTDYDSSSERLDISTLKQNTVYAIWYNHSRSNADRSLYVKVPINGTTYNYDFIINGRYFEADISLADGMFIYLVVVADLSTTISTGPIFYAFEQFNSINLARTISFNGSVLSSSSLHYDRGIVDDLSAQTISGVKTFNSFPLVSGTPTLNNELINKGFADTTYASQSDLSSLITYGTTDLSPGDTLPDGTLYIVYDNN